MADWQPYREPLRVTLTRTIGIAIVAGAIASSWLGGIRRWPILVVLMLWPAFGGHWVDLLFLNWLRPRLPSGRAVQVAARIRCGSPVGSFSRSARASRRCSSSHA